MNWFKSSQINQPQRFLTITLFIIALLCLGNSAWIYAKAWLAQQLIAASWQQSLQTGQTHKPWPWADTWPVGRLQLLDSRVDLFTLQGTAGSALAFGPGLVQLSDNAWLIAGHRDTHFQFMRDLSTGDQLLFTDSRGEQALYHVAEVAIIDSRKTQLSTSAEEAYLLLVTCYPFDALNANGPLRYVAKAIRQPATMQL